MERNDFMKNADDLIRALEPEIDAKCAEIKQKKSETVLTKVFIAVSAVMLIMPSVLIFFGAGLIAVFAPVIFAGAVILASLPILISKGAGYFEKI